MKYIWQRHRHKPSSFSIHTHMWNFFLLTTNISHLVDGRMKKKIFSFFIFSKDKAWKKISSSYFLKIVCWESEIQTITTDRVVTSLIFLISSSSFFLSFEEQHLFCLRSFSTSFVLFKLFTMFKLFYFLRNYYFLVSEHFEVFDLMSWVFWGF